MTLEQQPVTRPLSARGSRVATAALVLAGLHILATAVAGTVTWMPLGLTVATAATAAGWRWLPLGCRQDLAGVLGVLWLVAALRG